MTAPKLSWYALRSLARAATRPSALLGRGIGGALRERVTLRVSSVNSCAICSAMHQVVARLEGLDAGDIHQAASPAEDESLDERTLVALRYAEVRTADREGDFADEVARFEREFTADEQREIRAVTDLFTFTNRFNNTWEAVLPGASRRRRRLGLQEH
ncbi:MAG: carboxymuconolactone decarboxylase family protein [Deltaproteobacteria bacterium]|nr:carboxymuconolactone decarboxylase family protein [Deltaproteobacteria bacterium]